jgi:DNA mismatch endonuclease (patch repair protein)
MAVLPYPHPTSPEVSARMRRNPRRDTGPEVALRSELHRRGLRFRKDLALRVPGRVVRPDIAFTRRQLAVFIDGCFWHACPIHGNQPRANTDYWRPKLERNVARDQAVNIALGAAGWHVLRAWEHEPIDVVATRVERVLSELADSSAPGGLLPTRLA